MRTGGGFSHVATIEKRSFDGGIVDDSASTTDAQETVNGTWARNFESLQKSPDYKEPDREPAQSASF